MAYVKLDCGMLDSTIWFEKDARTVFITALLMASPVELRTPTKTYIPGTLNESDFVIPPGWYGLVRAASLGIVYRAMVDPASGEQAIKLLASPDTDSRSKDFEGRRMVPIDGGFIILNFDKYRQKDHTASERSRRWRERKAAATVTAEDIAAVIEAFKLAWCEKFTASSWHFDGILRKKLPNLTPQDIEPIKHAFDAHVSKLEATKFFNPEKFCATWRAHLEG